MIDKIFCSKCNSISNYDPYFKKYVCSSCGHMESKEFKNGIVLEKAYGHFNCFVIQDIKTFKRDRYMLKNSDAMESQIPYETVVLYDVVEYETDGNKLMHLQTKYNLLLDEITRR